MCIRTYVPCMYAWTSVSTHTKCTMMSSIWSWWWWWRRWEGDFSSPLCFVVVLWKKKSRKETTHNEILFYSFIYLFIRDLLIWIRSRASVGKRNGAPIRCPSHIHSTSLSLSQQQLPSLLCVSIVCTTVCPRYHCLCFQILHAIYSQFSSLTSCHSRERPNPEWSFENGVVIWIKIVLSVNKGWVWGGCRICNEGQWYLRRTL